MTPEQRQEIIRILQSSGELSPEWARILFPPEKREYELVYHGKEREEDILADTLAVPLQPVRTFGKNSSHGTDNWQNMLIFGDNLQAMKSLLEMKKSGQLNNADGTPGIRLVYIDPPFATKQDFRGTQDQKAYQDKVMATRGKLSMADIGRMNQLSEQDEARANNAIAKKYKLSVKEVEQTFLKVTTSRN